MGKREAQVMDQRAAETEAAAMEGTFAGIGVGVYGHPEAFQVAGPQHVAFPNWKDLLKSKWKDTKYRRTVMACFTQAIYLLELDRQENRTMYNALAPNWWIPFKYKLVKVLVDERDGSIFGAIFEWDHASAMSDLILTRPRGAPKAVLALRGTLLRAPTFKSDLKDDLRFFAWESLKGSVRFDVALGALKYAADKYGSSNICVAGHSLGAGFAFQVGRALAEDGIYVEAHLFNPPSLSINMSLKGVGEKAALVWKQIKTAIASRIKRNIKARVSKKWVPHLYVNDSDYICCQYTNKSMIYPISKHDDVVSTTHGSVSPKMFVASKENQKFLEAHKLRQWWSDDLVIETALNHSKLITEQLKSLYSLPSSPDLSPGRS